MAQSVKVENHLPAFKMALYSNMDDAIREAAKDVLIKAKNRAPFRKGGLRANADFKKVKPLRQVVNFWMEYAGYQEFGQRKDGSHVVRRYTTLGTGKNYLKKSGDEEVEKLKGRFSKHARRLEGKRF